MTSNVMQVNLNIDINDSTALRFVSYNSQLNLMLITFVSGGTYTYDNVSPFDALGFVTRAIELGSWGKAYHEWSNMREATLDSNYEEQVTAFFNNLNPRDIERFDSEWKRKKATLLDERERVLQRKTQQALTASRQLS